MLHAKIHAIPVFMVVENKKSGMPATKKTLIYINTQHLDKPLLQTDFLQVSACEVSGGASEYQCSPHDFEDRFWSLEGPILHANGRKQEKPRNGCSHLFRTSSWQRLSVHERFCQIFWGLGVWAASSELHLSCREDRVCFASAQLASKYQPTSLIQCNN